MADFVIVVDTQYDFMAADGALSVTGAHNLVAPARAWLASLDPAQTAGVLFTFDTHVADVYASSAEAEAFPIHCVRGTAGWNNVIGVEHVNSAIPVWTAEKGVFDMWAEDDLVIADARDAQAAPIPREPFFAQLKAAGVEDVVVIGVAADYCVRWAIDGLIQRGFRVTVPAALTRGIERQIEHVAAQDFAGAPLTVVST